MLSIHRFALAACMLFVTVAFAQEERAIDNFAGVGVRAMAMGGAYTGVADDFTALFWNPGGLAQIQDNRVYAAVQRGSRTTEATLSGTRATSDLNSTRFSALGVAFPYPVYRGSLVFAAGMMRVKDFDWSLRQQGFDAAAELHTDSRFRQEGGVTLAGIGGAVDVSPALSLGATVGISRGENVSSNEFTWTDTQDLFIERRWLARDSFDDEYRTRLHAIVGAMLRTPRRAPRFRLGATVSAGTTREISYSFRGLSDPYAYNVIEFDDGTVMENVIVEDDGSVSDVNVTTETGEYKLSLPLELALGGSLEPVPGLLLAASVHFAEWEQTSYEGYDKYGLRSNQVFERQYRNVARYHVGAEWRVPVIALDLRAGYFTDPLPFVGPRDAELEPDPETNPEIDIQQDRRFFTLGAGLLVDQVMQLDVSWCRGSFEQIEGYQDGETGTPLLIEDNSISRLAMSLGYRF